MLAIVGLVLGEGAFCGGGGRNEGGRAEGCEGRVVGVQLGERRDIGTVLYCGLASCWRWEEGGFTDCLYFSSTVTIGTIFTLDCYIPHSSG